MMPGSDQSKTVSIPMWVVSLITIVGGLLLGLLAMIRMYWDLNDPTWSGSDIVTVVIVIISLALVAAGRACLDHSD
jgi:membrane protein YdbS with pleckstrin-like domain